MLAVAVEGDRRPSLPVRGVPHFGCGLHEANGEIVACDSFGLIPQAFSSAVGGLCTFFSALANGVEVDDLAITIVWGAHRRRSGFRRSSMNRAITNVMS